MQRTPVALMLLIALASAGWAQSAADSKKKPAEPATQEAAGAKKKSVEAPVASPAGGPDTTTETFGDWSIVCTRPGGDARSCEVSTSIVLRNMAAPFARVAILRGPKEETMRLLALVPVNVTTQTPLRVTIEGGKADLTLPFRTCTPGGCLADVELGKEALQILETPAKAPAQLTVVDASGKAATIGFSLRGLDEALGAFLKQQTSN